jgi:hypothetical protein
MRSQRGSGFLHGRSTHTSAHSNALLARGQACVWRTSAAGAEFAFSSSNRRNPATALAQDWQRPDQACPLVYESSHGRSLMKGESARRIPAHCRKARPARDERKGSELLQPDRFRDVEGDPSARINTMFGLTQRLVADDTDLQTPRPPTC